MDNKKYKSRIDVAMLVGVAIGLAAASGLIIAAAIIGLTQASCAALFETYARAKLYFAFAALIPLLAAGAFLVSRHAQGMRAYWFCIRVGIGFLIAAPCYFAVSVLASQYNLRVATLHCFVGSNAEVASRLHERLKLAGPFDWRNYFSSPPGRPIAP
jgi:hypothetical protein